MKPSTIRVIISLVVSQHWDIQQVDVNNAFLNGILAEEIYIRQPEGFVDKMYPQHVCKLDKALYGLKQAPRAWYNTVKSTLLQWGFTSSKSNTSLFYHINNGSLLLLLIYVDDILITGNSSTEIKH